MKLLSLDFGLKRIGVAVGDTNSGIAFPREAIANDDKTLGSLKKLVETEKIEKILLGFPHKLDGSAGDIVDKLRQFSQRLEKVTNAPIEFIDERFTSKIASAKLHSAGIKTKQHKHLQDSVAAAVILEEYLAIAGH